MSHSLSAKTSPTKHVPCSATGDAVPIAIVGLGFGKWIVKALCEPEMKKRFKIVALCDLDAELAGNMAKEIGTRTATLEELLVDPEVAAIGLFTGPVGRAGLLRKIIRAGKHVMTTKPFERDISAAREVLEEAQGLGKVIYLNSPSPVPAADLLQIAEWRKKHALGRPLAAHASIWVRYNEKPDGRWLDDPQQCPVAPIFRLGIYLINDLVEIFGAAQEVQVLSSRLFTERPTPDHAQLGIKFRNGGLASILASFCVDDGDHYRNQLVLNFENGTVYRNFNRKEQTGPCELLLVMKDGDSAREVERVRLAEMSGQYPWDLFFEAVTSPTPALFTDPEKVCAGLCVIEAMGRAQTEGVALVGGN